MNKTVVRAAKSVCRDLRKRSARSEQIFWDAVRNRKILGKKFLRQYPIFFEYMNQKRFFIADFYCYEKRLVVEIDGKNHDLQKEYDELRSYIINNMGINVIRFRNGQIVNNLERVLVRLKTVFYEGTHPESLSYKERN
ncbi:MAG: endonuclease domain-containing protein [candidate division Zixibacteria bacterium]|nr:endonuclease domain-containing protein [candidate division Zixibacteria bacterium]